MSVDIAPQGTNCPDFQHVLFMGPAGVRCAYCDYGVKFDPLGKEFEKVLYDNLWDLME